MKSDSITIRLALVLLSLLLGSRLDASTVTSGLPGMSSNIAQVLSNADLIVVGRIIDLGPVEAKAHGVKSYHFVKVVVSSVLKGAAANQIRITVRVRNLFFNEHEPEMNHSYIFLLKTETPDSLAALMILEATDTNVNRIKTLIH